MIEDFQIGFISNVDVPLIEKRDFKILNINDSGTKIIIFVTIVSLRQRL